MKSATHNILFISAILASVGVPAHAATIYVNNNSSCVLPSCTGSTANVGSTSTSAFKRLSEAATKVQPGDTLSIAYSATPYYMYDNGIKPGTLVSFPDSVFALTSAQGGPSAANPTTIAGTGSGRPIIRGTLKFSGWQPVAGYTKRYYLDWSLVRNDGGGKLEPQQIFRSLSSGDVRLGQVGGEVFGGYPTVTPTDMVGVATGPLWPGRKAVNFASAGISSSIVLADNEFYYDRGSNKIYVQLKASDPALSLTDNLEVSVQRYLFRATGISNLSLRSITFERSNTSTYARGAALSLNGTNIKLTGVIVQEADTQCIDLSGTNSTIQNSYFLKCGQTGIHANGSGHNISYNYIYGNNYRGFNTSWEAGGMKNIGNAGLTNSNITYNTVDSNKGDGIWIDTDGANNNITNNLVAYNDAIGVHIELSNTQNIDNNIIIGNGAQGIQLVDSANNNVRYNNIVWNNGGGIYSKNDSRKVTPNFDVTVGNSIHHNVMGWNDEVNNRRPVEIDGNTTLDYNTYCGSAASTDGNTGLPSLHFWMSNLPSGSNIFWFSNWKTTAATTVSSRDLNSTMKTPTSGGSLQTYAAGQSLGSYAEVNDVINSSVNSLCK